MRRLAGSAWVRLAYFLALEVVIAWPKLGRAGLMNDHHDAQYNNLFEEVARLAVARFHEFPLWDPYYCGGLYGLGTPSARFISPTFILTLVFGTLRGNVLIMLVMSLVGMEGAARYARSRGGGALPAMLAAPVFALSGTFVNASAFDWVNFWSFQLVPWALLGVRRLLLGERRGLVIAAASFAWMLGFGGTYSGPLTVIACAFEVAATLATRVRHPTRVAQTFLLALLVPLLAASISMVRIWPIAETLASAPRFIGGTGGETAIHMWKDLTGEWWNGFHHDDFVIGLPVLPLLALGIVRKRALPLTIGGAIWLWLAMGYEANPSLFALLRHVPPYTMLRAPERFLLFFALTAVCVAALGIRRLEAAGRNRRGWLAVAVIAQLLLVGDTVLLGMNDRATAQERVMVRAPATMIRDFRQARGNRWLALYFPFMSRGSLACFDDYTVPQSPALRGDLPAEEYLNDPSAGTVQRLSWSPNRIRLHLALAHSARVYVNANWHPGWRADVGHVVDDNGLLAVDLPEGTRDVTIRFLPRSGVGGIATSFLGMLAAAALWAFAARRPLIETARDWLAIAGLSVSPLVGVAFAFALIREPPHPPHPLTTPEGYPVALASPPEDAKRLDVQFELGINLEAEHIDVRPLSNESGVEVTTDLYFRLDARPPPGLGLVVHLERPGARVAADHVLLSGAVPFEGAPLHVTLRDRLDPVTLSKLDGPATCNVYVGVWWARRDATRLHVLEASGHTVVDSRVLIDSFETP